MVRATTLMLSCMVALTGCATVPEPAPLPIDASLLEWSKARGSNTISGDAVLRTVGGDVKTCAGLGVKLLPISADTERWARFTYGPNGGLYSPPLFGARSIPFEADPYVRRQTCNAQGRFSFQGLPDGQYFVIATVTWSAPTRYGLESQGGDVAKRVEVRGGQELEVTIAP